MTKADFDEIYSAPDPRPYFRELGDLDYQVPAHGSNVFTQIGETLRATRDLDVVRVADLCCSYGINGALLKYDVEYDEVVEHYTDAACADLDLAAMLERDRQFFGARDENDGYSVLGLDVSTDAIDYATAAGLLDHGVAHDLEVEAPPTELASQLHDIDLVTVTGGIGYITETTVDHVLAEAETSPWMAALCLRWIDFGPVEAAAADHGLVCERLEDVTFPQRRFADDAEQTYVLAQLDRLGIDPTAREADGYHHTDLFVLRPESDAATTPIHELVSIG